MNRGVMRVNLGKDDELYRRTYTEIQPPAKPSYKMHCKRSIVYDIHPTPLAGLAVLVTPAQPV